MGSFDPVHVELPRCTAVLKKDVVSMLCGGMKIFSYEMCIRRDPKLLCNNPPYKISGSLFLGKVDVLHP